MKDVLEAQQRMAPDSRDKYLKGLVKAEEVLYYGAC